MRLYGIIGKPLDHSPSPQFYNAFFKKRGLSCRYLPFRVEKAHLKNLVLCMKLCDVYGLNVTIPYKEAVIPFLDGLDKSAKCCGAVNTIVRKKNKFIGTNTDGAGFLEVLRKKNFNPRNKTIVILGAGGAARGVAATLAGAGAKKIIFYNRHSARAKKAAAFFRKQFPKTKWSAAFSLPAADLMVQTTPRRKRRKNKMFDIRLETPSGRQMFLAQARLNLKLWGFFPSKKGKN